MRPLRLPDASGVQRLLAAAALAALGHGAVSFDRPVQAHGIETSLERLAPLTAGSFAAPATSSGGSSSNAGFSNSRQVPEDTLQLESRFSSGEPAQRAAVRLMPPQGEAIEVGRTDARGQLRFQLPPGASADWELQVDAGPGHRDYLEIREGLVDGEARGPLPDVGRSLQTRKLLVGLSGVGLGAAGLLSISHRRRR